MFVPRPVIRIRALPENGCTLIFETLTGVAYAVEHSSALDNANWTTLQTVSGTGGDVSVEDRAASPDTRFYRVRVNP